MEVQKEKHGGARRSRPLSVETEAQSL